ncbi:hypothetical protein LCGC14_0164540 [marine sediment metagenome]|uniref:HD/PDEase domain-containing protein n=1 Tax=marine sediment metagenome TaxID=412755 RepID=A0A0F9UUV4_9ZZZZ
MNFDTELVQCMVDRICDFHRGQTRKALPIPYTFHLFDVAKTLVNWGIEDADVIAAGLGHDLIEDTKDSHPSLIAQFGTRIAGMIDELTWVKEDGTSRTAKVKHWKQFAEHSTIQALVIKAADRYCNVRDYARQRSRDNEYEGEYAARYACYLYPVWRAIYTRQDEVSRVFGDRAQRLMDPDIRWIIRLIRCDVKICLDVINSRTVLIDGALDIGLGKELCDAQADLERLNHERSKNEKEIQAAELRLHKLNRRASDEPE